MDSPEGSALKEMFVCSPRCLFVCPFLCLINNNDKSGWFNYQTVHRQGFLQSAYIISLDISWIITASFDIQNDPNGKSSILKLVRDIF